MDAKLAEVTRGSLVEAVHEGSVAVVDTSGKLVAYAGEPDMHRYFRSSAKPFQSIPLVASGTADDYCLSRQELAIACSSHNASETHQDVVRSLLQKAKVHEWNLACGFTPPVDAEEAGRISLGVTEASPIKCECSGEHAGQLAVCRHANWSLEHYNDPDHPLQQHIRTTIAAACGVPRTQLESGTDNCALPTLASSLQSFARAWAVVADPEGADWDAPRSWRTALVRLREAMIQYPEFIAGENETDTVIMQETRGRVVAKLGAEGLLCLAIPRYGLGVAITDVSGSARALGPAAVAVLAQLELEDQATLDRLTVALCPPVLSFHGEPVGETRQVLKLERLSSARQLLDHPVPVTHDASLTASPAGEIG